VARLAASTESESTLEVLLRDHLVGAGPEFAGNCLDVTVPFGFFFNNQFGLALEKL
jgi:hypothetical protein